MKSGLKELVNSYAKRAGCTKATAEVVVKDVLDILSDAMVDGGVSIVGKFSVEVVERAERQGVNPSTKEPMTTPAHKAFKFKASKALKEAVNK